MTKQIKSTYVTTRHTTVKATHTPARPTKPETNSRPTFRNKEITWDVYGDGDTVMIDAVMPRWVADLLQAMLKVCGQ